MPVVFGLINISFGYRQKVSHDFRKGSKTFLSRMQFGRVTSCHVVITSPYLNSRRLGSVILDFFSFKRESWQVYACDL